MSENKQHIAASGAKQGQWVNCIAKEQCKLGGLHVEKQELVNAQEWSGRRAWVDLTMKDYEDYLKSKVAGTLDSTKRPMETLEEKRARMAGDDGRITKAPEERKKQAGTKMRDSFEEAAKMEGATQAEYYAKLWEHYPEILALPVKDQAQLEKLLASKFAMSGNGDFTRKDKVVRDWINQGAINNLAKLDRQINYNPAKDPASWERLSEQAAKIRQQDKLRDQGARIEVLTREEKQMMDRMLSTGKRTTNTARNVSVQAVAKPASAPAAAPVRKPVSNNIPDYVPLNPDTTATRIVLDQLQKFEIPGQGAFGAKTKEDKIVEYMVRNQLTIKGDVRDFTVEKKPAGYYSSNLSALIETNYTNVKDISHYAKYHSAGTSLRKMKNVLEGYVERDAQNNQMAKSIHDSFVKESKSELSILLFQKGYESGDYLNRVNDATKASEIYELRQVVSQLKQQDEFTRAGL